MIKKIFLSIIFIIILFIIVFYVFLLHYIFGCFPPGKTVDEAARFPKYDNYIICREARETDYNWEMYDDKFNFLECINAENDEMIRSKYNYDFFCAGNYYYMYGYFGEDNEFGKVFILEDYDIVYPVKHGIYSSMFPLSRKFTYEIELND